ncbi:MAG: hypothetical protein E7243_05885 [Lacrimispora celerecrescens]|nr:hypothetical protein [Lacrimispora celerecrescens]
MADGAAAVPEVVLAVIPGVIPAVQGATAAETPEAEGPAAAAALGPKGSKEVVKRGKFFD